MYCSQCGQANDEGSKYCSGCGSALPETEAAAAQEAARPVDQAPTAIPMESGSAVSSGLGRIGRRVSSISPSLRRLLLIGGAVVLVCLVIGAVLWQSPLFAVPRYERTALALGEKYTDLFVEWGQSSQGSTEDFALKMNEVSAKAEADLAAWEKIDPPSSAYDGFHGTIAAGLRSISNPPGNESTTLEGLQAFRDWLNGFKPFLDVKTSLDDIKKQQSGK